MQTSGASRREIAEACLKSDVICTWKSILIDSFPPVVLIGSVAGKRSRQIPGNIRAPRAIDRIAGAKEVGMNGLIYLVGLIVVIMFILSFFGLR
jgi:hypothetical protein